MSAAKVFTQEELMMAVVMRLGDETHPPQSWLDLAAAFQDDDDDAIAAAHLTYLAEVIQRTLEVVALIEPKFELVVQP